MECRRLIPVQRVTDEAIRGVAMRPQTSAERGDQVDKPIRQVCSRAQARECTDRVKTFGIFLGSPKTVRLKDYPGTS